MSHPRLARLSGARSRTERWHTDTCVIEVYDATATDAWGNPLPEGQRYDDGDSYSCSWDPDRSREVLGDTQVDVIGDIIWITLDALSDLQDTRNRIRLTYRYGSALSTAITFEIEGPAKQFANQLGVPVRSKAT